jgi:putative NADH-flavin reductase
VAAGFEREVKILVLGPTGGTGRHVVAQALERGHEVTAFARNPGKIAERHERLRIVEGRVTDSGPALAQAARGHDALVSALGRGMSLKADGLIQQSVPRILAAMQGEGVRRLIFTSAIAVGETIRDAPLVPRLMARFVLRDLYADKIIGDDLIRRSDLDWTIVQPAQLTDGPMTARYRAGEHLQLSGIPKISRADTAHFIVSELEKPACVRKTVLLAY